MAIVNEFKSLKLLVEPRLEIVITSESYERIYKPKKIELT